MNLMTSNKHTAEKVDWHIVVMSKMDFKIALLVYYRYSEIKLTDEEVSFLMGKRNKYVFDLLDPTQKDKFKTEQLDILPTILECKIRDIIPNDVIANDTIMIRGRKKARSRKIIYEYIEIFQNQTNDGAKESDPQIIEKKTKKGERKEINPKVHELMLKLMEQGYFDKPKNALELYLHCKEKITSLFKPSDLQKSLAVLLRDDGKPPLLIKKIVDARYVYAVLIKRMPEL